MLTILSGLALQSPTFLSPRLLSTFFCPLHRYHCDRPGNPKWSWHARWSLMSEGLACLSVTAPHLGTPAAPLSKFTLRLRLRCSLTFSERVGPFGACLGTCSPLPEACSPSCPGRRTSAHLPPPAHVPAEGFPCPSPFCPSLCSEGPPNSGGIIRARTLSSLLGSKFGSGFGTK